MEASTAAISGARGPGIVNPIRSFLSKYGLIIVLLILPVIYGIQDINHDHSLARLGENVKDGISNGSIWALVEIGRAHV